MSQVVSRNLSPEKARQNMLRESLVVAFHGTAASIFGFAICWQSVSAASAELFARTNPLMRQYGRWRFLTYNCLIMQFVAYSLCFTAHFVPKLRKPKDFFFTTFALPVGTLVVTSFWSIWYFMGREYIFPIHLEQFYPPWLNHVTHTIILPINIAELLLVKHQYTSDRKSVTSLIGYTISYASFLLYIRFQTGRWVYPFLRELDTVPVATLIIGMMVSTVVVYKFGKLVNDFCHGIKNKITKGNKGNKTKSS